MNPVDEFEQMLAGLTGAIAGLPLDAALEAKLNRE